MVSTVVVLIFFVLVLYAYKNHNHELEATASAIRQIWSGSCRLSCRQSENSGFSGLSGLDKGHAQVSEANGCKTNAGQGTCVCETCPCALVDNVLRTCRPATNLYNHSIELISNGYFNVVKAICEAGRMAGGGVLDTGPGKSNLFTIKQVGSADNINFINQVAVKAEVDMNDPESSQKNQAESSKRKRFDFLPKKVASVVQSKLDLGQRKEIVFKDESNVTLKDLSKTEIVSLKGSLNEPDKRGSETSIRMVSERKSCSKCIEKGMVCMGTCPRSDGKENK